ncbi:unnamed protein product [Eruca vesicaria subsp. sativa]|uniref:BHLH domain-containing protein n=1 Tax=Eruca vesicaria subsp. sativa TaxID=29727 RepID=A0ABC8K9G5_ERUVS|nr:unnamed protein product [Eruca vesicaria subsp. sativa]
MTNEPKSKTPRSKHSATEQRRRSKINDRFQMLRQLIPNSDQKRDKASLPLEVNEYIHFLGKVDKHKVVPYQGKLMNWFSSNLSMILLNHLSPQSSQPCPSASDADAATMECENLSEVEEEEELSVNRDTISISSVYFQGLLKTLTETLQRSGVDLSKSSISVQIKLSKLPQKDEEIHLRVGHRSPNGDETHNDD